jgi:hypothetical protein
MKLPGSKVRWIGVEVPLQCYCIASVVQCSGVTEHIYGFHDCGSPPEHSHMPAPRYRSSKGPGKLFGPSSN